MVTPRQEVKAGTEQSPWRRAAYCLLDVLTHDLLCSIFNCVEEYQAGSGATHKGLGLPISITKVLILPYTHNQLDLDNLSMKIFSQGHCSMY